MGNHIRDIPYTKIKSALNELLAIEPTKRRKRLSKYYSLYDFLVPVERDENGDFYHLVGSIPRFFALYEEGDKVPCLIEPTTNYTERLLKVGRRFHNQYTKPEAKRDLIQLLLSHGYTLEEIKKETDLNVHRYTYRSTVPTQIRVDNDNQNHPTSTHTFNMIDLLSKLISNRVKDYLYKKAKSRELTQDQIKSIKRMLNHSGEEFNTLPYNQQIKVINYVLTSPALLPNLWKQKIDQLKEK